MEVRNDKPKTQKEAIFDIHQRVMRIETVVVGVPNTDDKGLVGEVEKGKNDRNYLHKKLGKLELRLWILIALLIGSGVLGGTALMQAMGS